MPVVAFQGTTDPEVAYNGGPGPKALTLPAIDGSGQTMGQQLQNNPHADIGLLPESIPAQVATWAKRNGCETHAASTHVAADVTRLSYSCPADASVDFYVIDGGGHTWAGAAIVVPASILGKTATSISANQIMWSFFEQHPLTGRFG